MSYEEKIQAAREAVAAAVLAKSGETLRAENVVVLYQDTAMEIVKMICVDYVVAPIHGWLYKVTLDISKADPATVEIYEKIA